MNFTLSPSQFKALSGLKFQPNWAIACLLWGLSTATQADVYNDVLQLMHSGKLAEAQELSKNHIQANPRDPQMRFLQAEVLTQLGQTQAAIAELESLSTEYPELPEPYNNLAVLYAKGQHYEKARRALEMALKTNPRYTTALENLGDVYAKLASESYAQALALSPASPTLSVKIDRLTQVFNTASDAALVVDPLNSKDPVAQALRSWAKAWSSRDMPSYLASYAPDFQPGKHQSLEKWRTERYQRITSRNRIQVSLKDLHIQYASEDVATATFIETYQADGLSLAHQKVMDLKRVNNRWLIQRESSDD
jgi:tetratricopeptide (TPR) repeat protein